MDKKLLIVEDDQILNDMYATKFQKYGYEVKS
ncbi:response regulator transcription factor [bacterium]|jgi:DNA-binding response OmpR family regulator|nr:response regulator transcription factor [bacterium]MBT4632691.1 response regulator transcription factor [bacterium]MBT5491849.1 response regulator transcription factor [bacterium]